MEKIKIWFWWTPELASKVLENLYNNDNFEIKFTVSWIDKPSWRNLIMQPTPVKKYSCEKNIKCFTPEKIRWNNLFIDEIKKIEVDYFVVVAYGKILPIEILEMPKKMCINVHWSILPKYRWASPIQSTLIEWEKITWVTIMKMSEWMDEGDILDILEINIDKFDTSWSLFKKFALVSWDFLAKTLIKHYNWDIEPRAQNNKNATYCKKITKEDWLLNIQNTAEEIFYKWRWFTPWPGLYTYFEGKKLIITNCDYIKNWEIWKVNWEIWKVIKTNFWYWIICWDWEILELIEVKLEWKKSQKIWDFINWHKNFVWYFLKN